MDVCVIYLDDEKTPSRSWLLAIRQISINFNLQARLYEENPENYKLSKWDIIARVKEITDRIERKEIVLVALMRFKKAVRAHDGTEEEKVAAAMSPFQTSSIPNCFSCGASGGALFVCTCKEAHSATNSASLTTGRITRSRASKRGSAIRREIVARTRCWSASCYPWR